MRGGGGADAQTDARGWSFASVGERTLHARAASRARTRSRAPGRLAERARPGSRLASALGSRALASAALPRASPSIALGSGVIVGPESDGGLGRAAEQEHRAPRAGAKAKKKKANEKKKKGDAAQPGTPPARSS